MSGKSELPVSLQVYSIQRYYSSIGLAIVISIFQRTEKSGNNREPNLLVQHAPYIKSKNAVPWYYCSVERIQNFPGFSCFGTTPPIPHSCSQRDSWRLDLFCPLLSSISPAIPLPLSSLSASLLVLIKN